MAVMGQQGIVEGLDYRGVPVLAAMRAVPGTPWSLVAKVDQEEIYAPLRHRAWTTGFVVGLAILTSALVVGLMWRQRENRWLRREMGEQERVSLAVRESEARRIAVLDNIPDPAWLKDVEGRYLAVNEAWCRFVGIDRARALGNTDNEWRAPEVAARLRAEDATVIGSRVQCRYEQSMVHADGSIRFIDTFKSPVLDAQGVVVGTVGIGRDITERKRAEEALRDTTRTLQLATASAKLGVWDWNVSTNTLDWDDLMLEIYGGKRESFKGCFESWRDRLHPDEVAAAMADTQAALHGDREYDTEFRIVRPDGAVRRIKANAVTIRDSAGKPLRQIGVNRDITDQRQAEQSREATIELLRICNETSGTHDFLSNLTAYFQRFTGCEAVGVRLREGDDFPYYETRGFPAEFVLAETHLCTRDAAGQPVRDSTGNPVLECMCGNILCGRFDPAKPFFTKHGSFWSNNTTQLLATTTDADRQARTRNRCNGEGYESVALVPIRTSGRTLGLLQLNSRQIGRFTLERIQLIEQLADYVAIAVAKLQTEEALRQREAWHRTILRTAMDGFWLADIQGRLLEVSDTYCRMIGYSEQELLGMCVSDVEAAETPDEVAAHARQIREQGEARFDTRHRRKDGSIFDVEVSIQYRPVNGGRCVAFLRDITERKRAEEALAASRRLLQAITDNSLSPIYALDSAGRFLLINRRLELILGAPREALLGKTREACMPGETAAVHRANDQRVIAERQPITFEEEHDEADGKHTYLSVKFPLPAADGSDYGVGGISTDITDRKRTEEALRLSEEHYHSLFENMLNGFAYCRMLFEDGRPYDFTYLEVNSAFESLTGLKNVVGRKVSEVIPGFRESDAELLEIYGRVARTGRPESVERYVRALQMWFEISVYSPKKDHFAAVFDVVTDRKRAEEALRRSEAELDAIFENAPVAMLLVDADRTVRKVNRAAERLAGGESIRMVGQRGGDALRCVGALNVAGGCGFGPHCDHCVVRRTVMDTFATGQAHAQVETAMTVAPGDTTQEISLVISTALLIAGEERMVLLCVEDVTARKRLEAQLLQGQKMEAIGRLAGGIAHDFRNQLTVVKGYGEMLLRMSLIKAGKENLVGEILSAAHRGSQLTGQLLAFSRRDMLLPSVVNLGKVVADLAGPMGRLVGEDIITSTTGGGPELMVDIAAIQFEHAMMNLAANARDAMPHGGNLTIDTAAVEVDERLAGLPPDAQVGPYVRVTVRDTGTGMDQATQARLFEPFFTTKERGKGTGLGLPMVYGFVRQSGGFITVHSEPGKGTAFLLYFPRASADEKAETRGVAEGGVRPGMGANRGTEAILVVEDEEPIRWLISNCLRECGYTVTATGDAQQALDAAQRGDARIDMLITDVVMPGQSGVELARQVRGRWPGIPVLFVSGYGADELSHRGVDLQRAELMVKPFRHDKLVETVRRMLDAAASPGV